MNFLSSVILLRINEMLNTTQTLNTPLLIGLRIAPWVGLKDVSDGQDVEGGVLDVRQVAGEEEEEEEYYQLSCINPVWKAYKSCFLRGRCQTPQTHCVCEYWNFLKLVFFFTANRDTGAENGHKVKLHDVL